MDFEKLVEVFEELEQTSSGNALREILSAFFKKVPAEDIDLVVYLTLGKIASDYESAVLGLAEKSILKSISVAGGRDLKKVREILRETGDAGLTAEKVMKKKPQTLVPLGKLSIHELFEKLHLIATTQGMGSTETKMNTIAAMLQKSSPKGAKYIVRVALGTLRMGVAEMTVLDALAIAYAGGKKDKVVLEAAYNICPDVGVIAKTLVTKGLKGLEKISVQVGIPIKMMLAQRVSELTDVEKKMPGSVLVEGKYDGERMQAHRDTNGKISLFSRRLENTTEQFPDLVEYLGKLKGGEFVIEGEILAYGSDGRPLPFQTLMQRRRKHEIEKYVKEIPVVLKAFDLLYREGKSYLNEPFSVRTRELGKLLGKGKHIIPAEMIETDNLEEINKFFHKMLDRGYEGIMIKNKDGVYQAGQRGWNWIKWKKDYVKDLSDTVDLVVIGAFYGRGRRSGTYGALLCACYDADADRFLSVCKLGTGLTDEVLASLPSLLPKVDKRPARVEVSREMVPDVWFSPVKVVEVLAAEVTKSPYHTLGLALRFPRFVRFRDDKKAEQATTKVEIEEMA